MISYRPRVRAKPAYQADVVRKPEWNSDKSKSMAVTAHHLGQFPVFDVAPFSLQPKLKINAPGDRYEKEADRMADQVMAMTAPVVQRKCGSCGKKEEERIQRKPVAEQISTINSSSHAQRKCAQCEEEEEKQVLQTISNTDSAATASTNLTGKIEQSKGGGQSLDHTTRSFMESRFEADFNNIRIHADSNAQSMNQEINARAFTVGNHIYFNQGQYNPGLDIGKKLLAHELTHTVQQGNKIGRKIQRDYATELLNPDAVFEGFNGEQIDDAIDFNNRQRYSTRDISLYRDVFGLNPEPAVIDEDMINAIGEYQAQNNLVVDGKMRLGGPTARRLARELRAEGRFLGGREGAELMAARRRLCPRGVKTLTVDFVKLSGSSRNPRTDLAVANRVFRHCCVRFVIGQNISVSAADTNTWLGGDTDVDRTQGAGCGNVGGEEQAMFDGATAANALSSRMRVFYVASFSTSGLAYSIPPYCATGLEAPYVNHAVIGNSALRDTLAHEFGHILINSGTHTGIVNPADTRNLMFAPGRSASAIDRTQCTTIFGNA